MNQPAAVPDFMAFSPRRFMRISGDPDGGFIIFGGKMVAAKDLSPMGKIVNAVLLHGAILAAGRFSALTRLKSPEISGGQCPRPGTEAV